MTNQPASGSPQVSSPQSRQIEPELTPGVGYPRFLVLVFAFG
jgi:hypothetical protein